MLLWILYITVIGICSDAGVLSVRATYTKFDMCKLVCYAFFFESSNEINLINIKYTLAKGDTQMWL